MLTAHSATCGGSCFIEGETCSGLASAFSAVCTACHRQFSIQSSHQITDSDRKKKWSVNVAAVLSQMATGGGLAGTTEFSSFFFRHTWYAEENVCQNRRVYWRSHEDSAD